MVPCAAAGQYDGCPARDDDGAGQPSPTDPRRRPPAPRRGGGARAARWRPARVLRGALSRRDARGRARHRRTPLRRWRAQGARRARLDVAFARRHLDALDAWRERRAPSLSWRIAFEAARSRSLLVLQHMLLGMNAHINLDLGIAAAETSPGGSLAALHGDFLAINGGLAAIMRRQRRRAPISPPREDPYPATMRTTRTTTRSWSRGAAEPRRRLSRVAQRHSSRPSPSERWFPRRRIAVHAMAAMASPAAPARTRTKGSGTGGGRSTMP